MQQQKSLVLNDEMLRCLSGEKNGQVTLTSQNPLGRFPDDEMRGFLNVSAHYVGGEKCSLMEIFCHDVENPHDFVNHRKIANRSDAVTPHGAATPCDAAIHRDAATHCDAGTHQRAKNFRCVWNRHDALIHHDVGNLHGIENRCLQSLLDLLDGVERPCL